MSEKNEAVKTEENSHKFVFESMISALERSGERLKIVAVCACISLVLAVAILIFGNAVNNRIWMDYVQTVQGGANAGVYQQPNQGPDM